MNNKILFGVWLVTLAAAISIRAHEGTQHNVPGGWNVIDLKDMNEAEKKVDEFIRREEKELGKAILVRA